MSVNGILPSVESVEAAQKLWELVCYAMEDPQSQQTLLHSSSNLCLIKALLDRAHQLDHFSFKVNKSHSHWLSTMLQLKDGESGYTPLHRAVLRADLPILLLLLRYTLSLQDQQSQLPINTRLLLQHRPLSLLMGDVPNLCEPIRSVFSTVDREGMTAFQLLQRLQVNRLTHCRQALNQHTASHACEVLTYGRSNHLALGVQGTTTVTTATTTTTFRPQRVTTFAQDRVGREGSAIAIAAAAHHTLVATRHGHLYAFGVGTGGRLGTGDRERHCPSPTRVLGPLSHRTVVAIAAAENHSLCVTSDGAVYAFGSNRFGQLGHKNNNHHNNNNNCDDPTFSSSRCCWPRRVDELWKRHIPCVKVAAGERHSVALSRTGEVFVWGCNSSGQLGIHSKSTGNGSVPHKVQRVDALWNPGKERICVEVAASSHATLVLAKPAAGGLPVNQVHAWGHGNHVPSRVQFSEQESRPKDDKYFPSASGSGGRSINPVGIACARHHNVAITSDGRVYTWGFHADPLGAGSKEMDATTATKLAKNAGSWPQLVTGMLPEEGGGIAVAVSASENHTAVVTDEGSLFTWGASHGKGVMGHEGVRWQPSPKRVSGVSRAVAVSAAKDHTVLLMGTCFPPPEASPTPLPSLERLASREVIKHVDLFNVLPVLMTAERTNCRHVMDYCHEFIRLNMDGVLNVVQKSTMHQYLREQEAGGLLLLDEDPRDRRERPLVLDVALAPVRRRHAVLNESETILSDPVEWIQACEKLFRKDSLNALLNRMRREHSRARPLQDDNPKYLRRRSSSSVGSISEAYKKGSNKRRSTSLASEAELDSKMSSSERCIMLTTNMDLSTRDLVQAKYDTLTREIRGLKKRLSQISALEGIVSPDEPENPASVLSPEQEEKIARRPQLESELCIFEPALERVERRMLQFNLRLKRLGSVGNEEEVKTNDEEAVSKLVEACSLESKESPHNMETSKAEAGTATVEAEDALKVPSVTLRCCLCKATCPDDKSYALHMNGRKHRNRVAQEAEKEKEKAAASMMAERHRQQLEGMTRGEEANIARTRTQPSAWAKPTIDYKGSVIPKYRLPQPNNSAQEIVEKDAHRPKSLHTIMAEEANKVGNQNVAGSARIAAYPASKSFQLPPGAAPAMKSPPWAAKSVVKPTVVISSPMSPPLRRTAASSNCSTPLHFPSVSPAKVTTPLRLPLGAAPPLKSPPWAAKPSKEASLPLMRSTPSPGHASKVMPSFGDFLRTAVTPEDAKTLPSPAPWSACAPPIQESGASAAAPTTPKPKAFSLCVRFEDIQKQEEDFRNNVQDQSYQDNSSWYIGRRERAGSFSAIQEAETKQRELELMIQEQREIEKQIQREVAEKKRVEKKRRQLAKKKLKKANLHEESQSQPRPDKNGNCKGTIKGTKECDDGVEQDPCGGQTSIRDTKSNSKCNNRRNNRNRTQQEKPGYDGAGAQATPPENKQSK